MIKNLFEIGMANKGKIGIGILVVGGIALAARAVIGLLANDEEIEDENQVELLTNED